MDSSSDPDKSISSGISIPNWMKQKIGDRYDLDDASAFSPPSQDDNFFCIRYPTTTVRRPSETNYHRINKYLESQPSVGSTAASAAPGPSTSATPMAANAGISRALAGQNAHFPTPLPLEVDPDDPPPNLGHRRGSKSLPASPLTSPNTSPKLGRKNGGGSALQNRYFTAAFPQPKQDGGYSGWLLAGLLGSRDPSTQSSAMEPLPPICESPGNLSVPGGDHQMSLRKSASAVTLRNKEEDDEEGAEGEKTVTVKPIFQEAKKVKVIKPKPSELREMNFWSPTSM